ncbi:hypothetical protein Tco_0637341 [Tanacetum coccineum]
MKDCSRKEQVQKLIEINGKDSFQESLEIIDSGMSSTIVKFCSLRSMANVNTAPVNGTHRPWTFSSKQTSSELLQQTKFFPPTIPAINIQQFWDIIRLDIDNNRAFSSPPTPDTLVEFVNKLGYPKEVMHLSNVTTNDMFQPWRALATIINLCLTGKRPRAPVLQILWGIVNRAHIDYAERIWEEFSQSIHTFTEDKRKLAQHTLGKKKATLILIQVSGHCQGHLKISAKEANAKVFGMTNYRMNSSIYVIREAGDNMMPIMEKVCQAINAKKSKPAPAKPMEKKRKPESESSETQLLAKRAKAGKVTKKRNVKSSKQLVDEFLMKVVPAA